MTARFCRTDSSVSASSTVHAGASTTYQNGRISRTPGRLASVSASRTGEAAAIQESSTSSVITLAAARVARRDGTIRRWKMRNGAGACGESGLNAIVHLVADRRALSPTLPSPPMSFSPRSLLVLSLAALVGAGSVPGSKNVPDTAASFVLDSAFLAAYQWRNIGPDRGGRSIAVSGVRGQPQVAYFGAAGGGLWKTTDGGENWAPVTDGQITSASVGAVAV